MSRACSRRRSRRPHHLPTLDTGPKAVKASRGLPQGTALGVAPVTELWEMHGLINSRPPRTIDRASYLLWSASGRARRVKVWGSIAVGAVMPAHLAYRLWTTPETVALNPPLSCATGTHLSNSGRSDVDMRKAKAIGAHAGATRSQSRVCLSRMLDSVYIFVYVS